MSYILDALRKSERERRAGEVPSLPAVVAEPPPRNRPWLAWLVAGMIVFNVAGLGYLWLQRRGAPAAPVSTAAPAGTPAPMAADGLTTAPKLAAEATGTVPMPPPTPAVAADAPAPTLIPPQAPPPAIQPVASAPQPVAPPPTPPAETRPAATAAPAPAAKPKPRPKPAARPEAVPARPAPKPPAPAQEPRLAAIQPPAAAPVPGIRPGPADSEAGATGRASAPRADLPVLREMPPEFRMRVPEFRVNMHAWSDVPAERFAIIDMKKYRAGERIAGGALLQEIRADSLVLDLDGTRFRVPLP